MRIAHSHNCFIADVQACINPQTTLIIKVELEEERASRSIKVNMRKALASATSEMYKLKMATFKNVQLEKFLALLKSFRIAVNGTWTTSVSGSIEYLRTVLHGEAIIYFDELASQNNGMANAYLKHIMEGLLGYFPPINSPSKKKRTMRRAMSKP